MARWGHLWLGAVLVESCQTSKVLRRNSLGVHFADVSISVCWIADNHNLWTGQPSSWWQSDHISSLTNTTIHHCIHRTVTITQQNQPQSRIPPKQQEHLDRWEHSARCSSATVVNNHYNAIARGFHLQCIKTPYKHIMPISLVHMSRSSSQQQIMQYSLQTGKTHQNIFVISSTKPSRFW